MLSSVEQAFVGREEIRAPLKTPVWEANFDWADFLIIMLTTTLSYNLYKMTMYNKKTSWYNKHTVTDKMSWDSTHSLSWQKTFHDYNNIK